MKTPNTELSTWVDLILRELVVGVGVAVKADDLSTTIRGVNNAKGIMAGAQDQAKKAILARIDKERREAYKTFLKGYTELFDEVKAEVDYLVEVEGFELPEIWQAKITQPIDFKIQQLELALSNGKEE